MSPSCFLAAMGYFPLVESANRSAVARVDFRIVCHVVESVYVARSAAHGVGLFSSSELHNLSPKPLIHLQLIGHMESQPLSEQPRYLTAEEIQREQAAFMTQVYGWMTIALLITAVVSIFTAGSPTLLGMIFGTPAVFFGLIIGEVLLVITLSAAVRRVSATVATMLFILYAVINGLTLASIFLLYTGGSIASTFFVTAGTFGAMSAYGYYTKRDLTSWGGFLLMALIGLMIASVVNLFLQNETLYWIATYAGVLIFVGLTAYDTQKIKAMNIIGNEGTDEDRKEAIMGALTLYLDFINMFLFLLRLFGRRR